MEGHVALVTGAARGLGRAFADKLLASGVKVLLVDILEENGLQTARELGAEYGADKVKFYKCDVSSNVDLAEAFKAALETFGRLDIVCNNAGINREDKVDQMLAINLGAVIHGTMLGLECMSPPRGHGGVVINTASAAGFISVPYVPVYGAAKHGVVGFTRSIGENSLNKNKVRVNCICPTFVKTELFEDFAEAEPEAIEQRERLIQSIGMLGLDEVAREFHRLVLMESVTGAALLVSPAASRIVNMPNTVEQVVSMSDHLTP